MGTRHLTVVVSDSAVRLAVYGQYDGYPTSALADIRNALNLPDAWEHCRQHIRGSVVVDEMRRGDYETASIRVGYGIIAELVERPVVTVDALAFGQDSLFCEYAYIVDLDRRTVELYGGFNKARAVGAFGGAKLDSDYQAVTFLLAWPSEALAALSDVDLNTLDDRSGALAIAARKRLPLGIEPTSRKLIAAGVKPYDFSTVAAFKRESKG